MIARAYAGPFMFASRSAVRSGSVELGRDRRHLCLIDDGLAAREPAADVNVLEEQLRGGRCHAGLYPSHPGSSVALHDHGAEAHLALRDAVVRPVHVVELVRFRDDLHFPLRDVVERFI